MNTKQAYKTLQKASGIKVGDTVRVLRRALSYEMGWGTNWVSDMSKYIGRDFKVSRVHDTDGVLLNDKWLFPFFVLEVVKSKPAFVKVKLNDEYTAEVYSDKIVVGCQTFDTSIARNLLKAVDKMKHEELQKMKKYLDELE